MIRRDLRHCRLTPSGCLAVVGTTAMLLASSGCGSGKSAASGSDDAHPAPSAAMTDVLAEGDGPSPDQSTPSAPAAGVTPASTQADLVGDLGESGCERVVSFEAVVLSEPPPFDVVIVADHSGSVGWSRDELTAGLSTLLDDAYGRDMRIFVLTPTQYGASSAQALDFFSSDPLVQWQDPASGQPYQHEMTRYSETCVDGDGTTIQCPARGQHEQVYTATGTWDFVMPDPIAVITSDMTAAQVDAQRDLLVDGITALGESGSPDEQPLCTLNRYIRQAPENLPQNVIFIVLSDEDDTSDPGDCLIHYQFQTVAIDADAPTSGCTADCDRYRYRATAVGTDRKLTFDCVAVDDLGNELPEQPPTQELHFPATQTCKEAVAECTTGDLAGAEIVCGSNTPIANCQKLCTEGAAERYCYLWLESPVDACTDPIEVDGIAYTNLAEYCSATEGGDDWGDCEREGFSIERHTGFSSSSYRQPMLAASSQLAMVRSFQTLAEGAFGKDGFFVESIVFDPRFSCELSPGQSYATELSTVSTSPDDVFPICESYAPALARAQQFADTLLQTQYALELEPTESIQAITVAGRDDEQRVLAAEEYTYDAQTGTLHIDPAALRASDLSLSVELLDPCVRPVK